MRLYTPWLENSPTGRRDPQQWFKAIVLGYLPEHRYIVVVGARLLSGSVGQEPPFTGRT